MGYFHSRASVSRIFVAILWGVFSLSCLSQLLSEDEVLALEKISSGLKNTYWNISRSSCVEATSFNKTFEDSDNRIHCSVACDCSFHNNTECHVTNIRLLGLNLTGSLPVEFSNLTYLREINLTRNFLKGSIPAELARIPLVIFSVGGNRLTGTIPEEFGNISTLEVMDLRENLFEGNLPSSLGSLSRLRRLLLWGSNFNGTIPTTFANLKNLTEFRIDGTSISGKIPDFIGNWTSLRRLEIQGTSMEGPIPDTISQLRNLTELRISDLNVTMMSFPNLEDITSLIRLVLKNSSITGAIPAYLSNNDNLVQLDLSFNMLTGEIPVSLERLNAINFMFLSHNSLTGAVPRWISSSRHNMDLSYNNFTGPFVVDTCNQFSHVNLVASHSFTPNNSWCVQRGLPCPLRSSNYHTFFINCGGSRSNFEGHEYETNTATEGRSHFESYDKWGYSSTGVFNANSEEAFFITTNISSMQSSADIYRTARIAPTSLKYYGFCMRRGSYKVRLHFAEIMFSHDSTFSSVGRRMFDVAIQGQVVLSNFDISREANGTGIGIYREFDNIAVNNSTLEIHLYWTGKGTVTIPRPSVYGPLISAIAVTPNFDVNRRPSVKAIVGIVVSSFVAGVLILFIFWWKGCFGVIVVEDKELRALDLRTGYFSLRHIQHATNNFDPSNKIGEGGFGPVYKGVLSDGTIIAVKQLSAKSRQGNREFVNEIGTISALQHHNLVKLFGCCIEGNQLLLIYEYLENNSLARALFGKPEERLNLDWTTRNKICIGIAKGLAYLHEESRLKIIHRDIKASNVLLDKDLNAKISDFGLAKLDEEENTHISTRIAGTIGYMAPEYALRGYLTDKADVYSFGIVALEIVSGKSNTNYRPKEEFVYLLDWAYVLQEQGNLLELVDPSLGSEYSKEEALRMLDLSLLCTNLSPTLRPSMSSVVSMLEGNIPVHVPRVKRTGDSNEEMRFKAFELLSHDNHSTFSKHYELGGTSTADYPWVGSSLSVEGKDEETLYHSPSKHLFSGSLNSDFLSNDSS